MASSPTKVRIRAYNVGFGDCFLLSFDYASGDKRHMLIDFGTTHPAKRGAPKNMKQVAEQIAEDCNGKLHVVAATHRHADHISGFAGESGAIITALQPELVVQPWTERPDLAPDATAPVMATAGRRENGSRRAVAQLANVHLMAEVVARDVSRLAAARTVPKTVIEQLRFLGADNVRNAEAVTTLATLGRRKPVYAHFGMKLPVRSLLPGVTIDVLGPPTVQQSRAVTKQARVSEEFWHLTASSARIRLGTTGTKPIFPDAPTEKKVPQEARWVIPYIDRMSAEETLSLVRILDDVLNNTSLILLIDVGGTLLLFPGDAQVENWSYALRDAPNAAEIRARLAETRVYKVGHHGSLNATPKKMLWEALSRAGKEVPEERLITLVSTFAGKHGSDARGTEVPRKTLVSELQTRSTYFTTQEGTTAKTFWRDVEVPL